MENRKSRADLIAEGRKKFQNFKQKKEKETKSRRPGKYTKNSSKSECSAGDDLSNASRVNVDVVPNDLMNVLAPELDEVNYTIAIESSSENSLIVNRESDHIDSLNIESEKEESSLNIGTRPLHGDSLEVSKEKAETSQPNDQEIERDYMLNLETERIGAPSEQVALEIAHSSSFTLTKQLREDDHIINPDYDSHMASYSKPLLESSATVKDKETSDPLVQLNENPSQVLLCSSEPNDDGHLTLTVVPLDQELTCSGLEQNDECGKRDRVSLDHDQSFRLGFFNKENPEGMDLLQSDAINEGKSLEETNLKHEGRIFDDVNQQSHLHDAIRSPKVEYVDLFHEELSSPGNSTEPLDIYALAKILSGLNEEDLHLLAKLVQRDHMKDLGNNNNSVYRDCLENLKCHLYMKTITADYLLLQLTDKNEAQADFDGKHLHLKNEISSLQSSVRETCESNTKITNELMQCKNELESLCTKKAEVEIQWLDAKKEMDALNEAGFEVQCKLQKSQEEVTELSVELANCKDLLIDLQRENATLVEERKKQDEQDKYFANECLKLSTEMVEYKDQLVMSTREKTQLEASLREAITCIERLEDDKIYFSNCFDVYNLCMGDIIEESYKSWPAQNRCSMKDVDLAYDSDLLNNYEASGMLIFRRHLDETVTVMQMLDKAIQGLYLHSAALSRPGKLAASGVSKIIQAFEMKTQIDDTTSGDALLTDGESMSDSFKLAKEQIYNLKAVLKRMDLDFLKICELYDEEQKNKKHLTSSLNNLSVDFELLKHENDNLEGKRRDLFDKMIEYQATVDDLVCQLKEIEQNASDVGGSISSRVDCILSELNDLVSVLNKEQNTIRILVYEALIKIDPSDVSSLPDFENLDVVTCTTVLINASTKVIENLHGKLRGSQDDFDLKITNLSKQYERVTWHLINIFNQLYTLTKESSGNIEGIDVFTWGDDLFDLLPSQWEEVMAQMKKLLDEREQLESTKSELESDLFRKTCHIEELGGQCAVLAKKASESESAKLELELILNNKTQDIEKLSNIYLDLSHKLELSEFENNNLKTELTNRTKMIESIIDKLILEIRGNVQIDDAVMGMDEPLFHLETLVNLILKKYREIDEEVTLSKNFLLEVSSNKDISVDDWIAPLYTLLREKFGSKLAEEHRDPLTNCQEEGVYTLKEKLSEMTAALQVAHAELHMKETELQQAELRQSSIKEKLSIAVAKGKGLVAQRDALKQSLMEKSFDFEKCLQELKSKDHFLREVETKLKIYSEAGERIEALESELSYIRNSSAALRESFLLKDSVLQRVEEILGDIELPEAFHSGDIIEKIEWMTKFINENALFSNDFVPENSLKGSYPESRFTLHTWKDDLKPSINQVYDDLKRKCEDLQNKLFGLAEQNDMLEQSLMDRNNLIRRWEEVLDRISMPPQLRSMEPENKIEWLGKMLLDVQQSRDSLQLRIESLEDDLEGAQKKTSDLEIMLDVFEHEKLLFSEKLENLTHQHEKVVEKLILDEIEKDGFQREEAILQEKFTKIEEEYNHMKDEIKNLEKLITNAFPNDATGGSFSENSSADVLYGLINKLLIRCTDLSIQSSLPDGSGELAAQEIPLIPLMEERIRKEIEAKEQDFLLIKENFQKDIQTKEQESLLVMEKLNTALKDLNISEKEKNAAKDRCHSLLNEVEQLTKQKNNLHQHLSLEEQKSANAREKLNVAVRKGKALVQQRDSLKQTIDNMSAEIESLRNDKNQKEIDLVKYEQKLEELSTYPGKFDVLVSENSSLRNRLEESGQTLGKIFALLEGINLGDETHNNSLVQKINFLVEQYHILHARLASYEHHMNTSQKSAELLVAEMNQIQERAGKLQEKLINAEASIVDLSKQRDTLEETRRETVLHIEKLVSAHSDEKKAQRDKLEDIRSSMAQIYRVCFNFGNLLTSVSARELDFLFNLGISLDNLLKWVEDFNLSLQVSEDLFSSNLVNLPSTDALLEKKLQEHFDDHNATEILDVTCHELHECMKELDGLKEKFHKRSFVFEQRAGQLAELIRTIHKEIIKHDGQSKSLTNAITDLQLMKEEKEREIDELQRNISILYEACTSSISEFASMGLCPSGLETSLDSAIIVNKGSLKSSSLTDESICKVADLLLSSVKKCISTQTDMVEAKEKALKASISLMQKELQEKDINTNRICAELVTQIKEAESTTKIYMANLDIANARINNLEKHLDKVEKERKLLELKVDDLKDIEVSSKEMKERIGPLTDLLASKEQEIEGLMQALDEEETQMESLMAKIEDLERTVELKDDAIDKLDSSREKIVSKLSTTVTKFNELHHLSENLLLEMERLQSQLQDKDSEISFLRHEVTRCTGEVIASQERNKSNLDQANKLSNLIDMLLSRLDIEVQIEDYNENKFLACKDVLERHVTSILSELGELRMLVEQKDAMLQAERNKLEDLLQKREFREISLHEIVPESGRLESRGSLQEPSEMETMNKRVMNTGSAAPHVRGLRKITTNDQVSIAIHPETPYNTLDDDDDKGHDFKSLIMSRAVPRFTRPISDKIDGLWVSGGRVLMKHPTLRLGILIYCAALHILLASSII